MFSIPKATEPHLLETYTPEVVRAYVSSRLESVSVVLREGLDDPLDDVTVIQQQLDQVCNDSFFFFCSKGGIFGCRCMIKVLSFLIFVKLLFLFFPFSLFHSPLFPHYSVAHFHSILTTFNPQLP